MTTDVSPAFQVALSTSGKFHTFDLARQLHKRGLLAAVFTGYPWAKLKGEGLPRTVVRAFPWLHAVYMAQARLPVRSRALEREVVWLAKRGLDAYATRNLPTCDVFIGLSSCGLGPGRATQARGGAYVCDRGSSHIRYQDRLLSEEWARQGLRFAGVDPRIIAKEEAEYAAADLITVPSRFVQRSFLEMGVDESKLRVVPYGVDLSRFAPDGSPDPDEFHVLFVGSASIRKGIPDLLRAFESLRHPRKRLTLVGTVAPEIAPIVAEYAARLPITLAGHQPQAKLKGIMSRSHVLVLASVEEGLALVQGQALACGCPVVATTNTGGEDLFDDGVAGFIVPIRDPDALANRLQRLADEPDLRAQMSRAALESVGRLGGWDAYGDRMAALCAELTAGKRAGGRMGDTREHSLPWG